jgi:hypothetical protein
MYVITTDVSINLAIYFVDVIQRAAVDKKVSLPFSRLTSRVTIMAKIPLCNNDPNNKYLWKDLSHNYCQI